MASTSKPTIAWTVAQWLTDKAPCGVVDLGASFYFTRGEGDRGSFMWLFPTIVRQLMSKMHGSNVRVAEAMRSSPDLCSKSLGEQFRKLVSQPLQQVPVTARRHPTFVVAVDVLDECVGSKTIDCDTDDAAALFNCSSSSILKA